MGNLDDLAREIERLNPSDLLTTFDRTRPYDGQAWTSEGTRGKEEIKGITFRDLKDCFIRACFDSAIVEPGECPETIYDLDWEKIDPLAVEQNMSCWVEKYMGIFPNCKKLIDRFKDIPTIELDGN